MLLDHEDGPGGQPGRSSDAPAPSRPLRICFVGDAFLGPCPDGDVAAAYTQLGEALGAAGHDVTFLHADSSPAPIGTPGPWADHFRGREIEYVRLPGGPFSIEAVAPCLSLGYRVYLWLKDHDGFDIIHFADRGGLGFFTLRARRQGAHFQRSTIVVGLHGPLAWERAANGLIVQSEPELEEDHAEREAAELADFVWAPGRSAFDWAEAQGWRFQRGNHIQPCAVANARDLASERFEARAIDEIVLLGRPGPVGGVPLFLEAIERLVETAPTELLRGVKLTVLARPLPAERFELERALQYRAQRWPIAVQARFDDDQAQTIAYLRGPGRLALDPSASLNCSSVVLECLGAGLPFLARRDGGAAEHIERVDVARCCFPPDARDLAKLLERALRSGHAPARPAFDPARNTREWISWHESLPERASKTSGEREPSIVLAADAAPTVSVCIVHHSRPGPLRQALDSIVAQDEAPLEVIVVDDGSPEASVQNELDAIVQDYDFSRRGWKLVRQENRYLGAARNEAARHARGDYLLFMDDDNVAKTDEVSTFRRVAGRTGADLVTCQSDLFSGRLAPGPHRSPRYRWLFSGLGAPLGLLHNRFGDANALVRRAPFEKLGGFTEDYGIVHEDWEFFSRLVLSGHRIESVPEALFWYRSTPGSLTAATPLRRNFMRSLRPYFEHVPKDYHALLEVCVGQSLVDRGWLWSAPPAPAAVATKAAEPPPLRYQIVDALNARLKRIPFLHAGAKVSIRVLAKARRWGRSLSSAWDRRASAASAPTNSPIPKEPKMLFRRSSASDPHGVPWPNFEEELGEHKRYLKGKVLNAGAGLRDLSSLVDGEVVNQDIPHGLHNKNIHIYSPIHQVPVDDDHFDTVFCNAVLEHVANPVEVVEEFYRVLKPGGHCYLCIPFLQPEHLDPTDFQRYTKDGLRKLVTDQGFEVVALEGVHSVYVTLTWIVNDWLNSNNSLTYRLMRSVLLPVLRHKARTSRAYVDSLASAYRVIARKPEARTLAKSA